MERVYSVFVWAFAVLSAYLAPMKEVFWCMLLFVTIDLIVGIIASSKNGIGRSSRRARKSVLKLLCYLGAVVMAFVAEKAFTGEMIGSYKWIGGFICLVEFISILENMATITGSPIFLKIIRLIRGTKGNLIKEILEEKNDGQKTT
ncbi:phage holin family protein [Gabonibacter massiliensis]|uniref:phage holin family protein n=1 Tax=Gabonibacter massiliensis TaxID=1720195 RepID=UPI00073E2F8E|nr:phage holin family protein [Gabonibacter massiliensis]